MRAGEMGFSTTEVGDLVVEGATGVSDPGAPPLAGRALRHHAARRRAARGPLLHDRGPPADPAQARSGGVPLRRGRLARREPARHRVLPARDEGNRCEHAQLTAFGMTRKAGERAEDSQVLRDLLDAGTEVVCLVGKAWDLHVTEALRTDLDEGVAMVRDSVAFLRAAGPPGVLRRRALLRRVPWPTRPSRCGCWRRRRRPAPSGSCCATRTAACSRSTSPRSSRPWASRSARRSGSTCTTTPAARSRTRWSRSTPACSRSRARSTGTASAPATPTSSRSRPTSC